MAIEWKKVQRRKHVAWLDAQPDASAREVFEAREYGVTSATAGDFQRRDFLAGMTAAVFEQTVDNPQKIVADLRAHARLLLDYDVRIILRALPDGVPVLVDAIDELRLPSVGLPLPQAEKLRVWQDDADGVPPSPYARYFDQSVPWSTVANFVSENPSGREPNEALAISLDEQARNAENQADLDRFKLLIRRAFWDCVDVHLKPMYGGKSGVKLYRAYAEVSGVEGRWPQPHFIKIGSRSQILTEYKIYEEGVDPFVPFHLGPHLERDRCLLGATLGILVGDFVEGSESLSDCACTGRSAAAIACLFDRTLLGWHRQARKVNTNSLADGLLNRFPRTRKFPVARMERAQALGATRGLDALRELFKRCDSKPVLVGPIHGDLHAANVLVRANEAVVIDFCAHRSDPLLFDAASLEASLLVKGFAGGDHDIEPWLRSVEALYEFPILEGGIIPANPKSASSWFHSSVNQIRRYARQWECAPNQYAGALALALLIKASKDRDVANPESDRRAAAYVLAERLLVKTFAAATPAQPAAEAS